MQQICKFCSVRQYASRSLKHRKIRNNKIEVTYHIPLAYGYREIKVSLTGLASLTRKKHKATVNSKLNTENILALPAKE